MQLWTPGGAGVNECVAGVRERKGVHGREDLGVVLERRWGTVSVCSSELSGIAVFEHRRCDLVRMLRI